jgi:hypothetical protein
MAKTNPIGVRFEPTVLEELKAKKLADTPQKALNFLQGFWRAHAAEIGRPVTLPPDYAAIGRIRAVKGSGEIVDPEPIKRFLKASGAAEKNRTASPLPEKKVAPRGFHDLLLALKEPGADKEALAAEIRAAALTPNQRDMLNAKLKNL